MFIYIFIHWPPTIWFDAWWRRRPFHLSDRCCCFTTLQKIIDSCISGPSFCLGDERLWNAPPFTLTFSSYIVIHKLPSRTNLGIHTFYIDKNVNL